MHYSLDDMAEGRTAWRKLFKRLLDAPTVAPRGMPVRELSPYTFKMPRYPFCCFKQRRLNFDYIRREFQWYLHGDKKDLRIADYAKIWRDHISKGQLHSNYGWYLFTQRGFLEAIEQLEVDKDSRRAVVTILNTHRHLGEKDVPCTYGIAFNIRNEFLNMHVHMRSNDVWYGLGNDGPIFHWFHLMAWHQLRLTYPSLKLGRYMHIADSLHLYVRDIPKVRELLDDEESFQPKAVPCISSQREVHGLLTGRWDCNQPFTAWLEEVSL